MTRMPSGSVGLGCSLASHARQSAATWRSNGVRSHSPLYTRFTTIDSVALFLKRQCDRTVGSKPEGWPEGEPQRVWPHRKRAVAGGVVQGDAVIPTENDSNDSKIIV